MTGPLISKSYGPSPPHYLRCHVERWSRRAAITPRTKVIIVNTPHNPVGKVYTRSELEKIAALAEEFNLLVMADEVVRSESSYYPGHTLNIVFSVRLPGL